MGTGCRVVDVSAGGVGLEVAIVCETSSIGIQECTTKSGYKNSLIDETILKLQKVRANMINHNVLGRK